MLRIDPRDKAELVDPLFTSGPRFWVAIAVLLAIIGWGGVMYARQLIFGLVETGMQRPTYWGVYMVNFIFLIGVSMAGTLVSAALYLSGVNWRRPITRIAETVTVFGLLIAGLQVLFDMGRPGQLLLIFTQGRLQSPLLWDMASLSTYIMASMFALYISLLPDLAILRDNYPRRGPLWRKQLYTFLSLGWRGNREQWQRLERVIKITAILIIPIGISLHTVTSWILSTTVQPGWHSTILGPYFVVGAIFSGIGLLFILLTVMRQMGGVKLYITKAHYRNLSWFLIIMSVTWFYFTYTEHLTIVAGQEEAEFPVLASKLWGGAAFGFWSMVIVMVIAFWVLVFPHLIPRTWAGGAVFQPRFTTAAAVSTALMLTLAFLPQEQLPAAGIGNFSGRAVLVVLTIVLAMIVGISALPWLKGHIVATNVIASVCIVVGMWLERWNIMIPTLVHPQLIPWSSYAPTATEWGIMAGSFALFVFLLLIFFKLFPPIAIWEIMEGRVIDQATAQIKIPPPEPSGPPRPRRGFGLRR